jgi:transposase
MSAHGPKRIDIDMKELDALLERLKKSAVDQKDYQLLEKLVGSFAYLTALLQDKDTTITRLRRAFGSKSEKSKDVLKEKEAEEVAPGPVRTPEADAATAGEPPATKAGAPPEETADEKEEEKRPGHGRNGAEDYPDAKWTEVSHQTLKPGDPCPKKGCDGRVYRLKEPGTIVRLRALTPFVVLIWALEKLRCNLCGEVFTATPPPEAGEEKYDATASSMITLLKYGTGMPFNRLDNLQKSLGVPLPASTQWDVVKAAWEKVKPAHEELVRQGAQGEVLHNDDTPAKILELMGERRQKALAKGAIAPDERTGIFTSGIMARVGDRKIALFFTGNKHAGENLAEVLKRRDEECGPPIQMSDGLSRNEPGEFATIMANCLAHSRRKYIDVLESFPGECRKVLEVLRAVYRNDAEAKKRGMTPEERLRWHQTESGPLMEKLKVWLTAQMEARKVEPNSGLGEAMSYMLRRWERLTLFLRVPRAPLDNNLVERSLKKAILHRKNALFYLSENGARVGDSFMSLIHTAELCGANPFEYLTELQRNEGRVRDAPAEWMPWNYQEALARIRAPAGPATG